MLLHKLSHRRGKKSFDVGFFANKSQQQSEVESLGSKKISEWQYYALSAASCGAGGGQTHRAAELARLFQSLLMRKTALTGLAADAPAHTHTHCPTSIFNSLPLFL